MHAGRVSANTSSAGVTRRWGLLSHAQNAVRWLAGLIHNICRSAPTLHAAVFHLKIAWAIIDYV